MTTVVLCHSDCRDLRRAAQANNTMIYYDYKNIDIDQLKDLIIRNAQVSIRNLGLHIQNKRFELTFNAQARSVINRQSLKPENSPVKRFFRWMIGERMSEGSFIDIFLVQPIHDTPELIALIQGITRKKISVRFISRFTSPDIPPHNRRIVDVYFDPMKMRSSSGVKTSSNHRQSGGSSNGPQTSGTSQYERIRTVGKGAFGSAVLYRRKDDGSLIIIKEINMYDLNSSQRQLALNEVSLLSQIDHPNIISYYDSFEEDGILMIEMEYADGGDLKTANVFLTREGFVKIGDFGISKIMGTDTLVQGAKTVVGTPYYISPEMCSGQTYNEKSDMWALGCILYEMCCLQKAFEGENLPALVNKIMSCSYTPIKGPYSAELKLLVRELLKLEPEARPTAANALKMLRPVPSVVRRLALQSAFSGNSTLYILDTSRISLRQMDTLPKRISIKQISVSETHQLILTRDNQVLSWGQNLNGQLGTGDRVNRNVPSVLDTVKDRCIRSVSAGNGFSVICCDRGTVLTCGKKRVVGLGKINDDVLRPTLVDSLLRMHINEILSGFDHTVAITEEGECYAWGDGADGKLGTGNTQQQWNPVKIAIPGNRRIIGGRAGPDATILITDDGNIIAFGNNRHNKLNLAQRQGFFSKEKSEDFDCILNPTVVRSFCARVVDVHVGRNHCGVILESGQVYLFGKNNCAELGHGHQRFVPFGGLRPVKSLIHKACSQVACGDGFTLVGTTDHELYFWGSKTSGRTQEDILASTGHHSLTLEDFDGTKMGGMPLVSGSTSHIPSSEHGRQTSRWATIRHRREAEMMEHVIPFPSLILRLDNGPDRGIRLSFIVACGRTVYVVVDDKERHSAKSTKMIRRGSAPSLNEKDNTTKMQTWLKNELQEAEYIPYDSKNKTQRGSQLSSSATLRQTTDSALIKEINLLKEQIKEQSCSFEGQRMQMTQLQDKLLELQARQAFLRKSEPPPAYNQTKRSVPYNKLFPENTSKTCSIL